MVFTTLFRLFDFGLQMREINQCLLAQLELFHLASYSHWELVDKSNVLWHFELGEAGDAVLLQCVNRQ